MYKDEGKVKGIGREVAGLKQGKWKYYDDEGKLAHKVHYLDNVARKLNGIIITEPTSISLGSDTIDLAMNGLAKGKGRYPKEEDFLDTTLVNDPLGQFKNSYTGLKGYVPGEIYLGSDTLRGHLDLRDSNTLKFTNAKTPITTYIPRQLKGFKLGEAHFESHFVGTIKKPYRFLQVAEQGLGYTILTEDFFHDKTKVYPGSNGLVGVHYDYLSRLPHGLLRVYYLYSNKVLTRALVVRRKDGKRNGLTTRKKMADAFSFCPEVQAKIEKRYMSYDSIHLFDLLDECR